MKIRIGDEVLNEHIRVRVRLDFKGTGKSGRFFFGGKSKEEMAEQKREQEVALFRNIPLQGIVIEDFDLSLDIYSVNESEGRRNREIAFAPVILTMRLDNLDNLLPLILRPEFRKIEFLSPENLSIDRLEAERLFFRIHELSKAEVQKIERQYQN